VYILLLSAPAIHRRSSPKTQFRTLCGLVSPNCPDTSALVPTAKVCEKQFGPKADDTVQILAPTVGAENWCRFLDSVSYRSGTKFCHRSIACSISCRFLVYTITRDHYGDRWLKEMFLCTMSWLLITITGIGDMDLSIFCVIHVDFWCRFFHTRSHLVRKIGADFWSVCHQLLCWTLLPHVLKCLV